MVAVVEPHSIAELPAARRGPGTSSKLQPWEVTLGPGWGGLEELSCCPVTVPFWGLPHSAPALPCCHLPALEHLSSPQCLFLVWCMAPVSWNGSQVLYQNIIRPCFLRHHQTVDNVLGNLSTKALDAASSVTREGNAGPPVPAVLLHVRDRRFSLEHSWDVGNSHVNYRQAPFSR